MPNNATLSKSCFASVDRIDLRLVELKGNKPILDSIGVYAIIDLGHSTLEFPFQRGGTRLFVL